MHFLLDFNVVIRFQKIAQKCADYYLVQVHMDMTQQPTIQCHTSQCDSRKKSNYFHTKWGLVNKPQQLHLKKLHSQL